MPHAAQGWLKQAFRGALICGAAFSLVYTAGRQRAAAAKPFDFSKTTYLDAASGGADFALQGEYVGQLRTDDGGVQSIGLQVRAMGDARFEAMLHRGGLPGAGASGGDVDSLTGRRHGRMLSVSDEDCIVVIQGERGQIFSTTNRVIGSLAKVHRGSPTMGAAAPTGATVLFDGKEAPHFDKAEVTPAGLLKPGVTTVMPVGDFTMHLEFRTPFMPYARGQARGNSGVYIQRRYEVQILDSFSLVSQPNDCGSLYKQQPPDVNMCLPPLSWQTYDITFRAARWDGEGRKTANARITVLQNGVAIHSNREITAKTGGGQPEAPRPLPLHLQFHGDEVRYRNAWIQLGQSDSSAGSSTNAAPDAARLPGGRRLRFPRRR